MITVSVHGQDLLTDLNSLGFRAHAAVRDSIEESAIDIRDQWRENAAETAGSHGHHYPRAINHDVHVGYTFIVARIAPDPGAQQGAMSFERGSVNQPPHNDGQNALDVVGPRIRPRIEAALAFT